MKVTTLIFLLFVIIMPVSSFASVEEDAVEPEKACFPVSTAAHDHHCYFIDNKPECMDTKDEYSCAWGIKKHKEHEDWDFSNCENSRCPNNEPDIQEE